MLESARRVLGPDHVNTRYGESVLARILAEEKRYEEAESLYRGSLESLRRTLGPEHGRTLNVMFNMASVLYIPWGKKEEASRLLCESYEIAARAHDQDYVRSVTYNLACLSAINGDKREALDWLRKSVEAGFDDAEGMSQDADLSSLHGDPEFERLLSAVKRNATPPAVTKP